MKISNMNIPFRGEHAKNLQNLTYGNITTENIRVRDPFILPYGDKYYLYQTKTEFEGKGVVCYVSEDLKNWSDPQYVFVAPENFHGLKNFFWAPEVHYYKGNFYLFTSVFSSRFNHRTIAIYRADNPLGPFVDITDGAISPTDWDAIDGTLYIDKQGAPWMVFVHEWTSMPDHNGSMVAARLSEDFTRLISEPIHLFYAKDPKWATNGVTDGPYLCRTQQGDLLMIWSNFSEKGYVVSRMRSKNGEIDGEWVQDEMLYQKDLRADFTADGGHGMIFQRHDGKYMLSLHGPQILQKGEYEHLLLLEVEDTGDNIRIK